MADLGLTKALRKGIGAAKVARPGLDDAAKAALPTPPPVQPPKIEPPKVELPAIDVPAQTAEATRLSTLKLGDYDLDAVHQTNFDTITTTDDIKAVIADTSERNKALIDESRRGVITNDQLKGLAADLDVQEDVVRQVLMRESGGTLNAETILAARQVLNASADRVLGLAKKISSGQATDLERIQFRRQVQFHDEYQRGFMGARAETGRALNAFGIPTGLDMDPARITRLKQAVENMHGRDTDELATMLSQIDTLEGVNNFVKKYNRSKVAGTLQELFINSILSGPKTALVNLGGNTLFNVMNGVELALAARVGKLLPGEQHIMVGEAQATLFGQLAGFTDAMRYAAKAFRMGEQLDGMAKFEGHTRRAISSRNYFPNGVPHPSLGAAIDILGAAIRLPTERLMAPTDAFFKTLAQRGELARQAYRSVMQEAAGKSLTNEEIAAKIAAFMESPPPGALNAAQDFSDYLTFQSPLGPIGSKVSMALNEVPGAFFVTPFVRTPVNVFMAGLVERSPLAVFSARFREAVRAGGPERDLALARVSLGTLTVASVAAASLNGAITGGGPQNPDARKILEATGWQPYSFVITDPATGRKTYQSYARAEPLAYVIGATADAAEILTYLDYDDELRTESEQANNAIAAIVAGVANNTMSKTFLQGVADFSEALNDPKRYAASWLQNTGSALIPYSSFRRQIGQVQDPLVREGWEWTDRLRNSSGIPGWSEKSPPRRDIFGQPIKYKGGPLLGSLSPFPVTQEKRDPVLSEVVNLMETTRTVPLTMPGRRVDGMKLTAEEYDELVRYARTEPLLNDTTFREALTDLMDSDLYTESTPDMRVALIKQTQDQYDRAAKRMLEEENAVFAERIALHRTKKQIRLYGEEIVQ